MMSPTIWEPTRLTRNAASSVPRIFAAWGVELAAEELAQHAGDVGFAGGGADDTGEALMELGLLEYVGQERGDALAHHGGVAGDDGGDHLGRVERQPDGGDEELLFEAEEVGDQPPIPETAVDGSERGPLVAFKVDSRKQTWEHRSD